MPIFNSFTLLLLLCAFFGYINSRFVRLPPTLGFMVGSLFLSIFLLVLQALDISFAADLIERLHGIDFSKTVLYGILSFLLFAGALQFNVAELAKERWLILTLSTCSVIIATLVVGALMTVVFMLFGFSIPWPYAFLFGALISPTDPVIIIGLFKGAKGDQPLKMTISGEALFNDGAAIILFVVLLAIVNAQGIEFGQIAYLLLRQVLGSVLLGLGLGWLTHRLISKTTQLSLQTLISLGFVAGGYDLALLFGTSGPIAIVIAGLFVRNYRSHGASGPLARHNLYRIWGVIDEFLNAALFVLMGFEILTLPSSWALWGAGLLAIAVVLFGRFASLFIPIGAIPSFKARAMGAVPLLTWAGLRGGISLALALSLPEGAAHNIILCSTYVVVLFSTLVQGLTVKKFINRGDCKSPV